jgi:hypothetical protein
MVLVHESLNLKLLSKLGGCNFFGFARFRGRNVRYPFALTTTVDSRGTSKLSRLREGHADHELGFDGAENLRGRIWCGAPKG